jgi:GNAT superfamily N-acetyltransferase
MSNVLQLVRILPAKPEITPVEGFKLRHYTGPADVELWLEIRRKAFARQKLGVRDWSAADFEREFLSKPWWTSRSMWFAESQATLLPPQAVGVVTLGWRGPLEAGKPVIHWLAVLPRFRRQGIARLLVQHLEQLVWESGRREIYLETLAAWTEAAAFYQALKYMPV